MKRVSEFVSALRITTQHTPQLHTYFRKLREKAFFCELTTSDERDAQGRGGDHVLSR